MASNQNITPIGALEQACNATEDTLNDMELAETAISTINFVVKQLIGDESLPSDARAKIRLIKDNLVLATYFTSKATNELDFIRAEWVGLVEKTKAGAA